MYLTGSWEITYIFKEVAHWVMVNNKYFQKIKGAYSIMTNDLYLFSRKQITGS
jgi:hypothetical protein